MQATKLIYAVTILGMLLVISGCTATERNEIGSDQVLQEYDSIHCKRGSIRPPGVPKCLIIDDILAGKIKFEAPKGKCPINWKKQSRNGFCLPAFQLIACGKNSFSCDNERADTLRIVRGPSSCKDGTITVITNAPRFDQDGELYLGFTTALACGPVGRIEPG